jgi:hypothetical protein
MRIALFFILYRPVPFHSGKWSWHKGVMGEKLSARHETDDKRIKWKIFKTGVLFLNW